MQLKNISSDWQGSTRAERRIIERVLKREGTGKAIVYFAQHCDHLSDYWYWYLLGTLWVHYSGWSELSLWRRLFSSSRPKRQTSLMKPDEYAVYQKLPDGLMTAYRAHRPGETDWISYTTTAQIAARFAVERAVFEVAEYGVPKSEILALFLRRGECELLVLDKSKVLRSQTIAVMLS